VEDGATRGRVHEADDVAPLVAVLHRCQRALPVEAPDFVQDRFQADTVLVGRPELDLGLGESRGDGLDERADLFF